ncbi:protein of unknown function [Candidatus Methylocalor cossyra]|uniref:Uncharacterized protein n=1 Tax=Candidatus Methylocalor cossyra TaxID=3108543 RepID=A0ABM9NFS4_9GAMM
MKEIANFELPVTGQNPLQLAG